MPRDVKKGIRIIRIFCRALNRIGRHQQGPIRYVAAVGMPLLPAPSLGFVLDLTSIKMLGLLTELQPFGRPLDLLYKFFFMEGVSLGRSRRIGVINQSDSGRPQMTWSAGHHMGTTDDRTAPGAPIFEGGGGSPFSRRPECRL